MSKNADHKDQGKRQRILVVDDDPKITQFLFRFLGEKGFDVCAVNDPRTAHDYASRIEPSLIILDFDMPQLLGSEVAVLLKSSPSTRHLPIVFLSGMTDEDHHAIAKFTGAVSYLHKPIDGDDLIAAIRKHLPTARP